MHNMDAVKIRVLNSLIRNANRSRKEIAHELGISESYISKIVKELEEFEGVIEKFTVQPNYRKLGYSGNFFTLIKLSDQHSGSFDQIVDSISKMPEAVEVFSVYGETDLFVRWICQDGESLMQTLKTSILNGDEVKSVQTFALGQQYKRSFGPEIPESDDLDE